MSKTHQHVNGYKVLNFAGAKRALRRFNTLVAWNDNGTKQRTITPHDLIDQNNGIKPLTLHDVRIACRRHRVTIAD